jgi:ribosomal protein S6
MATQDAEMREDDVLDDNGEPRVYELGFHLDPELPSEEVKKAYQAVRELAGDGLVAEGEPEKIQLAYTISRKEVAGRRDFDSAYFAWIAYETTAERHAEIIATANADKHIIRFIDLLTDKEAARHAVEMREIAAKTRKPEEEQRAEDPGAVLGAEIDVALEGVAI